VDWKWTGCCGEEEISFALAGNLAKISDIQTGA
jgi:hypothetical protein